MSIAETPVKKLTENPFDDAVNKAIATLKEENKMLRCSIDNLHDSYGQQLHEAEQALNDIKQTKTVDRAAWQIILNQLEQTREIICLHLAKQNIKE